MPKPAVSMQGIEKQLGYRRVLRGVTGEIPAGRITALLGNNGAGKTTLLRLLATILRPTKGEAFIFGRSLLTETNRTRQSMGFLGHGSGLYGGLSVEQNLFFAAKMRGLPAHRDVAEKAILQAHLEDYRKTPVRHLSKGLERRLALERALMHKPKLALLDEPFDGLDPTSQQRLITRLRAHRDQGGTAIIVTHDMHLAGKLCDQALVLRAGRLEEHADLSTEGLEASLTLSRGKA